MDTLICNKCFIPMHRGKQPYHITQCAHVFCQDCSQQAEKQCVQCESYSVVSVPLKEPLGPVLSPLFVPFEESFEMLRKVDAFRNNQMKISIKRLHELDKKYELLKNQYWIMRKKFTELTNKFMNLKMEKDRTDKKLMFFDMQQGPFKESSKITPKNSNIFIHPLSSGYSSESMERHSASITPMQPIDVRRQYKPADGFRVPIKRQDMSSKNSYDTDTSLNSRFMG